MNRFFLSFPRNKIWIHKTGEFSGTLAYGGVEVGTGGSVGGGAGL